MIFITLGSQKFQFNRLLKEIDRLIEAKVITDSVFAQIGASDYIPIHYQYQHFMDMDDYKKYTQNCDLFITHGGTGAIIGAVKQGKKVIAIPRLAKYGEHVDDHQIQLLNQFDNMNLICSCYDVSDLERCLETVKITNYEIYKSNTSNIINSIEDYIQTLK